MKKTITITLTALSAILIFDSMQAGQAIMMFLLAGVVPGTSIAISGGAALSFFASIIGFILARIYVSKFSTLSATNAELQKA